MGVENVDLGEEFVDAVVGCVSGDGVVEGGELVDVPETEGDYEICLLRGSWESDVGLDLRSEVWEEGFFGGFFRVGFRVGEVDGV